MFVKKITFLKVFNALRTGLSYVLSLIFRKPIHFGMPLSLSIEPVNYCNLQCPECPTGNGTLSRSKKAIEYALFQKIINELSPYLMNLFLYFQGEPFLHNRIIDMISFAHSKRVYTVISTNANTLNTNTIERIIASGLDKIIISLDGVDSDTYTKYRRKGDFSKVINAITELVRQRKKAKVRHPIIELQFLVFSFNEHQEQSFRQLGRRLGADILTIKSAQFYDFGKGKTGMPIKSTHTRYKKKKDGNYIIKNKLHNRCWRLWNSSVITSAGDIIPCCFDKNAKFIFGNINDETFISIWENKKVDDFRRKILNSRTSIKMCNNCISDI